MRIVDRSITPDLDYVPRNPYAELWLTCLVHGLYSAAGRDLGNFNSSEADLAWLLDRTSDYVGSCRWICETFEIDYDAMMELWEANKEMIKSASQLHTVSILPAIKMGRPPKTDHRQCEMFQWIVSAD